MTDYHHKGRPVDLQLGSTPNLDVAILAADPWAYVAHVIGAQQPPNPEALAFWRQAECFARGLPAEHDEAKPLHLYYTVLNGVKALLRYRGITAATNTHGASVTANLVGQSPPLPGQLTVKQNGVFPALCTELADPIPVSPVPLMDMLAHVVWVHRAWCTTAQISPDDAYFLPVEGPVRLKELPGAAQVAFEATLSPNASKVARVPPILLSTGAPWEYRAAPILISDVDGGTFRQQHQALRQHVHLIAGRGRPTYYILREDRPSPIGLSQLSLDFAVTLTMSSLSRYHPLEWAAALHGTYGWVLREYLKLAPAQVVALLAGEITGRVIQTPYSLP